MVNLPEKMAKESIRHFLFKGDVLFWDSYLFKDGNKKTSLFIVLTDCINDNLLVMRATSQLSFYEKSSGFQREFIKILEREDPLFSKPTILDLNSVHVFSVEKMKESYGEKIKMRGTLSKNVFEKLEKLIRNSETLRKDWINWVLKSKVRGST